MDALDTLFRSSANPSQLVTTDDIDAASYLLTCGHALQAVKLSSGLRGRSSFTFSPAAMNDLMAFHQGHATVNPRAFGASLRNIKAKIHYTRELSTQ